MAADMRHAGLHWPENAGGEHPNVETILGMPGIQRGCTLICSPSARYWYRQARGASPLVVWRAIPRQGKLPAQLGWDRKRVADEVLNLWGEQPHGGIEFFLPLNELNFVKESGQDFPGYQQMAQHLAALRIELRSRLPADVRLMFPAWVPSDDGTYLDQWRDVAEQYDAICVHCYGSAETMRARYQSYRDAFSGKPLFVGEWNSNHEGHDERASLQMWADVASADPLFLGATYFIWETNNAGEQDLSIWGNEDRLRLFQNPPTAALPAPVPDPIPVPEPTPMTEYEAFIRDAAQKRGIDPDIAVRVANSEGSVTEPARRGTFDTGSSWWAFQLHYGGAGYEYLGGTAGMGNGFTELTGWQPGDVDAWKDATRYALNRAKLNGWGAWYGAAHVGIGQWDGIDRDHAWNASSETWDYEAGVTPMPATTVAYNAGTPALAQNDPWSCSTTSLRWALTALGRHPAESWIEDTMKAEGVVTEADGLLDATGKGLADFVTRQYAEFGFYANSEPSVTFDGVALEGDHAYPLLIGGRSWGHWSGVRGYDAGRDLLLLANPADGWKGISQTMNRGQWDALGPFSMVRVLHPDLLAVLPPEPVPVPVPQPSRARVLVGEIRARLDELAGLVA